MDRVIFQLRRQIGFKKLFALKGIQTFDLMGLPQRPRPLPLESTPWGLEPITNHKNKKVKRPLKIKLTSE
jgi:hypothetical protein